MYWSEQSFTGLGPDDQCWSWGLHRYIQHFPFDLTE